MRMLLPKRTGASSITLIKMTFLLAAFAIAPISAPAPQGDLQTVGSVRIDNREVLIRWPSSKLDPAAMKIDVGDGFSLAVAPNGATPELVYGDGGWDGMAQRYKRAQAAAATASMWRMLVTVFRNSQSVASVAGADIPRRASLSAEDVRRLQDYLAQMMALAEATTDGAVKIQLDFVVDESIYRFDRNREPFDHPFLSSYFASRVNTGEYEPDDRRFRGPYHSIIAIHPTIDWQSDQNVKDPVGQAPIASVPFFAETKRPDFGAQLYAVWADQVARVAQHKGYDAPRPTVWPNPLSGLPDMPDVSDVATASMWPTLVSSSAVFDADFRRREAARRGSLSSTLQDPWLLPFRDVPSVGVEFGAAGLGSELRRGAPSRNPMSGRLGASIVWGVNRAAVTRTQRGYDLFLPLSWAVRLQPHLANVAQVARTAGEKGLIVFELPGPVEIPTLVNLLTLGAPPIVQTLGTRDTRLTCDGVALTGFVSESGRRLPVEDGGVPYASWPGTGIAGMAEFGEVRRPATLVKALPWSIGLPLLVGTPHGIRVHESLLTDQSITWRPPAGWTQEKQEGGILFRAPANASPGSFTIDVPEYGLTFDARWFGPGPINLLPYARAGTDGTMTVTPPAAANAPLAVRESGGSRTGSAVLVAMPNQGPELASYRYLRYRARTNSADAYVLLVSASGNDFEHSSSVPLVIAKGDAWTEGVVDLWSISANVPLALEHIALVAAPGYRSGERRSIGWNGIEFDVLELAAEGEVAMPTPSPSAIEEAAWCHSLPENPSAEERDRLLAMLASGDGYLTLNATAAYTRIKDTRAVPLLANELIGLNFLNAERAASALAFQDTPEAWQALTAAFNSSGFDIYRLLAAQQLVKGGRPFNLAMLGLVAASSDTQIKLDTADLLAGMPGEEPQLILVSMLQDDDPQVRAAVIDRVNPANPLAARRLQWYAVNDTSDLVRAKAAVRLLSTESAEFRRQAMAAVRDDSWVTRAYVVSQVTHDTPDVVGEVVQLALADRHPLVRLAGLARAIDRTSPTTIAAGSALASEEDPRVQLLMVLGIRAGKLNVPPATLELLRSSPYPAVVAEARRN